MLHVFLAAVALAISGASGLAEESIQLDAKRELFVDAFVIDRISGGAALVLHRPEPQEVVLTTDKPWEGNTSAYFTIFQDGEIFRMYYRGSHFDEVTKKATHAEVTCYAESRNGVDWVKPDLGLFDFEGSMHNNIVWNGVGTHCFTVFKDQNPDCKPEARYKAISRGRPSHPAGLYVFRSPDAIHWSLYAEQPVITQGAFDSQNLAFWDAHAGQYRAYFRTFQDRVRHIATSTSADFLHWTEPVSLSFPDAPVEHLYTNAVMPYERAPHLLIGFPTRYLPQQGERVEPTFMSSRDRLNFHRWTEPIIPETAPQDRAGNRSNYLTWGLLQLPGNDREYSVYATEAYYTGPDSRVRRFTYRLDGFVSVHADAEVGSLVTKPLQIQGNQLRLNSKAAPGGRVLVELQDASGQTLEGFSAADCVPVTTDAIDQAVAWKGEKSLAAIAGAPFRIRFEIKHADVYSFRFSGE